MAQHYLKLGYPQDLITQSRDKAFAVLHYDLIHKSVKKTASESRTPLMTTFNTTNPVLMGLVDKYWPILQSTTRRAILFKTLPVHAYRWSENLRDILVRAKLKPLNTQQTNAFSMRSVLTRLFQSKPSKKLLDCGRKIRNDVHIDTHYCKPELMSWPLISTTVFNTRFLSPTDQKCADLSTYWEFLYYRSTSKFRHTHVHRREMSLKLWN